MRMSDILSGEEQDTLALNTSEVLTFGETDKKELVTKMDKLEAAKVQLINYMQDMRELHKKIMKVLKANKCKTEAKDDEEGIFQYSEYNFNEVFKQYEVKVKSTVEESYKSLKEDYSADMLQLKFGQPLPKT